MTNTRKYTHIPVIRWTGNGSGKLYGTIVVDGAMSEPQIAQLRSYLDEDGGFVPARVQGVQDLEWNNLSGKWHEMFLPNLEVTDSDRADGEDLDEHFHHIPQFLAAMRIASERGWHTDKQIKAAKRAQREATEAEILEAAHAARASYRTRLVPTRSICSDRYTDAFIEDALALIDKIIGDGGQS